MFKKNLENLRTSLQKNNIDIAIITDDDSLYYFTGYFDYLHMSFGRPTLLLVPKDSDSVLITPSFADPSTAKTMPGCKIVVFPDTNCGSSNMLKPVALPHLNVGYG